MAEPITLEDARRQLGICDVAFDEFLTDAIVHARGWVESYTGLSLIRREVVEVLAAFSKPLQSWPIVSIDEVQYLDGAGVTSILPVDAYALRDEGRPARLFAATFPRIRVGTRISVTLTAGFDNAAAINAYSPVLMGVMRQLIAGLFFNRETGISGDVERSAKDLCRPYRRMRV